MRSRTLLWAPLLAGLIGYGALFAFARAGWPGAPNGCIAADDCFCEAFHEGPVKQPANTWSALAFLAAGLLIAAHSSREGAKLGVRPGSGRVVFMPAFYSVLVVLVGVGTAFFHASMTWWGGSLDYLSMYHLLAYIFAFGVIRSARLARGAFLPLFLLALVPAAAVNLSDLMDTPPIFALLVAAAIAAESSAALRRRDLKRDGRWLAATFALFAAGALVWARSNNHGAWCRPGSLLQGHALWHLLCAAATVTLYLYYASEREAALA